jgi:iron complex transport system ATP-binding protein
VREWRLQALARERAVLTQEQRISFPFPVRDVVEMGRAPWRGRPEEDLDDLEVAAAMRTSEVDHLATRSFGSLSGGEKGRASFARVLAQQTGILMLDEPTAALDIGHQETLLTTARERARAGAAVLVVLHDLTLAGAHADRIVLLEDGRVAASGAPRDVLDADLLTRVYRHPIEVVPHPRTGDPLVLAARGGDHAPTTPLHREDSC